MTKAKLDYNHLIQWLILLLIPLGVWAETIIVLFILLSKKWNNILFFTMLVCLLLLHSCIISMLFNYEIHKSLQQCLLIFIYGTAYSSFFKYVAKDLNDIWIKYLKCCSFYSYLAFFQLAVVLVIGVDPFAIFNEKEYEGIIRIHAYFGEAAYFATFLIPCIAYFLLDFKRIKGNRFNFFLIFTSFTFSFSSIGIVMLAFILIYKLLISKYRLLFFASVLFTISLYGSILISNIYKTSVNEKDLLTQSLLKISETIEVFNDLSPNEFEMLNLSTYAIAANLWVAQNAPNRLLGTGIGSHPQSYEIVYQSNYRYYGLNKDDAYSGLIRIYSEFGLFGLILVFFFLIKCFNKQNTINVCVFFYLMAFLLRGGHYTYNGVFFFVFLYYLTRLYKDFNSTSSQIFAK